MRTDIWVLQASDPGGIVVWIFVSICVNICEYFWVYLWVFVWIFEFFEAELSCSQGLDPGEWWRLSGPLIAAATQLVPTHFSC